MKGIPVLKSKLNMPQLPPTVAVPERLQRLINEIYERQAVIITAPAGYGKTTLMVTALSGYHSKGCRICWYRLDEEDRDLAVFYTHLVETLFPEEEGIWEEPRSHLANCGDIFTQHQYLNALFCQELWAFCNLRPDIKIFIVIDDFQQILDTPEITGAIQFFIDNLPDSCEVIVSSRCETGLLTGKRRLEKNILEITRWELCFSEEELAGLIKEKYGLTPEQSLLQKIMLHTEGWPAGIILVCQMLSRSSTDEAGNVLDRSGRKELLFQYIITEVLNALDHRLLRFLAKAAILREFTAAEAITVFEEENAPQLLEKCEQKGLFIQKIFGATTTYRFHSLFREALQQIQPQHLSPEEVKNYHLKAAAYDIEHRIFDRAIEHFIICGNVDLAVELVTRESARLIAFEAVEQLRLWFKLLPEELVSGNGYLLYFKSFIHYQRDINDAMRLLEQALAIFQQEVNCAMQINTLVAMAHMYVQSNDILGIKRINAQMSALSKIVQGPPLEGMLTVFDFAVSIWEEKFARGATLSRCVKSLVMVGEWHWMVFIYSCAMYYLLGDLNRAARHVKEALEMDLVKRAELLRGYTLMFYSMILQLKDEQDMQPLIMEELLAIGEKHDYKFILGFGKRLAALDSYRRHDLEGALALLDASTHFFEELGNTPMASSNKLSRCLWQCRQGNNSELLAGAKKALKVLTAAPSGLCLQEIGLSVLGAIARDSGDYKLAEKSLTAAIKRSKSKGARQILCGSCLHLAKLCYNAGDQARGEAYLRQAMDLASENKYVMFWDMHFPTLVEMAARCVKNQIHADYAQALIARYYGSEAAEFLGRTAVLTADDHLKDFAGAFLSRYGAHDESQAPRISVNLFGRFSIAVNGITIPENEWKTKKIAGVLKFLVVHRGRPVSKDRLMEVFWPGADKKSASMSLRAAQYELKKVLRKYGVAAEGKASILNEKRDSLEVRAGSLLAVDVDSFLAFSNELKVLPPNKSGNGQKKIILERMVALYRRDFLEEEVYEDWAFAEREELRSIYFGSVIELAGIFIMNGDNRKAEKLLLNTLAMDPYNEEACLCLLKLYIATNQRGRAVKLYSDFVNRFEKELRIKPDERLASVFKELE
ncbi:MAG: hypothetical protein VR69_08230 [Peptococcaceae bacterium BRH_c4b]|nr:MAG: hypothetical protein VR69_08230 [Peptococcaceae bacterium BRH_c4b]